MLNELTLITISYNSAEILPQHLSSLDLAQLPEENRPQWLVVDNASADDSSALVQRDFPLVQLIDNHDNVGFGAAANVGIQAAQTRYVMILNPDTILSPEALQTLLSHIQSQPKVALVGPNVSHTPSRAPEPESVEWIVGAAMLFDTQRMAPIGFFDERFFLYYEETDLCHRIIDAGLEILQCHDAAIPHSEGDSSGDTSNEFLLYHRGRSHVLISQKHPQRYPSKAQYLKKQRQRMLIARLTFNKKRFTAAKAKLKGALSVD